MCSRKVAVAALASVAAFAAFTPLCNAGIVPLSRNSLVHIEGQAKTDDLGKDQSTSAYETFNQTITSTGGNPAGTHANASAGQNSVVDISKPNKITGSGSLATSAFAQFAADDTAGPLMVRATSALTLVFQIENASEPFHADGTFGDLSPAGAVSTFTLQRNAATPGGQPVLLVNDGNVSTLTFDENLTLPNGTYTLEAKTASGSSGSSPQDPLSFGESHAMNFSFSGGSGATAIPLPSTARTGAVFLLAGAGAALIAERRRFHA